MAAKEDLKLCARYDGDDLVITIDSGDFVARHRQRAKHDTFSNLPSEVGVGTYALFATYKREGVATTATGRLEDMVGGLAVIIEKAPNQ